MTLQTPKLILQYIHEDDIIDYFRFYNMLSELKHTFFYELESTAEEIQHGRAEVHCYSIQYMASNVIHHLGGKD